MRETIVIKLAKPLITQSGPISQIILREPSFDEYLELGDPYTVAGSKDGQAFMVENAEVIKAYISLCLVEPKDPALLVQAGARVARDLKQKLLGFFQPAVETDEASATSGTNLSLEASKSAPPKSAG